MKQVEMFRDQFEIWNKRSGENLISWWTTGEFENSQEYFRRSDSRNWWASFLWIRRTCKVHNKGMLNSISETHEDEAQADRDSLEN